MPIINSQEETLKHWD